MARGLEGGREGRKYGVLFMYIESESEAKFARGPTTQKESGEESVEGFLHVVLALAHLNYHPVGVI